ncbi:hypothetical protein IKE71_01390 [Candidatus Saccharibacteria bacterium]|nr:hypothetical protein [Candidatus Saccharibacteria bacterium]
MARTDALSILASSETKDKLIELGGKLIESIQKNAVSSYIKNTDYSGDPTSGSVEINRFDNATVDNYGTARAAGKGKALKNSGKVTINLDQDKEITTEIEFKDLKLFGVAGLLEKRTANHGKRAVAHLDRAFFAVAEAAGTAVTSSATEYIDIVDEMIANAESTTNEYVDGVDREDLVLAIKPTVFNALRKYVDKYDNGVDSGEVNKIHGVEVYSNFRQDADIVLMVKGAVAQPVAVSDYTAEKIPLAEAFAAETYLHYGTKAIMPDLIWTYGGGDESGESE